MDKHKAFSILNVILIIALVFGLLTKIFFMSRISSEFGKIFIVLGIVAILIHLLLIFAVVNKSKWGYAFSAIFAGKSLVSVDFSPGSLIITFVALVICIISLIQLCTYKKYQAANKKGIKLKK